jgi:hypothetical protein
MSDPPKTGMETGIKSMAWRLLNNPEGRCIARQTAGAAKNRSVQKA